jgi:hypothetical protein
VLLRENLFLQVERPHWSQFADQYQAKRRSCNLLSLRNNGMEAFSQNWKSRFTFRNCETLGHRFSNVIQQSIGLARCMIQWR